MDGIDDKMKLSHFMESRLAIFLKQLREAGVDCVICRQLLAPATLNFLTTNSVTVCHGVQIEEIRYLEVAAHASCWSPFVDDELSLKMCDVIHAMLSINDLPETTNIVCYQKIQSVEVNSMSVTLFTMKVIGPQALICGPTTEIADYSRTV